MDRSPGVDLYWLPLGAGGNFVRLNGRLYEALLSRLQRRPARDLYHSALVVALPEARYVVEMTPAGGPGERGVVGVGPVGARWAGRLRAFRYELRRWREGVIPDLAEAVDSPRRLTRDPATGRRLLDLAPSVPMLVWGRDEIGAGEMWNSNSQISWLLARAGLDPAGIEPPAGGRAPGWSAGILAAGLDRLTGGARGDGRPSAAGPNAPGDGRGRAADSTSMRAEEPPRSSLLAWTGIAGIAAAVVYAGATLAGSVLDPGYSQVRQHVSDLTATGAPSWAALAPAYALYNLLALAFGIGVYLASTRTLLFKLGLAALALNVFAGLMMVSWFREDAGGVPATFAGSGHLVFAGVSSLTIVAGSILYGFAFRRTALWRPLSGFSFAIAGGFLVLGPLAVIATAGGSPLAGLAERGPIGLFIVWITVLGIHALARAARTRGPGRLPRPRAA